MSALEEPDGDEEVYNPNSNTRTRLATMKPNPVKTLKSFDSTPHVGFEPKSAIKPPRPIYKSNST